MVEPDLQKSLRCLHESLKRIKALVAWERLKRREAQSGQISMFQMYDSTVEDLRNEYTLLITALPNMHSILNSPSSIISQTTRDDIGRQLAEIEWQLYRLRLYQRFGGPLP